ncbi:MAG: response regulator transcription factor [Acidimicrobiales bacterium]|nr:response regulator transcription factor [Acidimicrobiales bacterium]MCB9392835.1 response regulator transcription factor [Acidimicrobiaceae bacterium]
MLPSRASGADVAAAVSVVGREHELAVLLDEFAACRARHEGRVVVVHGPNGCGSSALLRHLRDELRRRRLEHEWWQGRCSRQAPIPYEPFVGLLRDVPGDASTWLAEAASAGGAEAGGVALLAGLARRVRGAAAVRPVVAVVDDVDGADASTLRLLDGLLPLLDDVPVLVALAGRSTPSGVAPHQLVRVGVAEVRVTPLDPDHVARVVRDAAPDLDDTAVAGVVRASAGRPGLASALARAGDAERALSAVLDTVHPSAALVVAAAGLADGWLDAAQLAELAGVGPEVVAALESQRVLTTGPHGRPLPSSELWVTAARRSLGVRDRRGTAEPAAAADAPAVVALAARVAARLERFAPAAPGSVTATVWETAGRVDRAGEAWERAADEAAATHAVGTAAAALRRAIELGGDDALLRLGRRAGEWSLAAGDRVDADRLAARLLPRLARADRPAQIGALALRYRARLEAGLGGHDDALDRALEIDAPPCRERVDVLVIDALRRVLDDPVGAGATAAMALADARVLADRASIAHAAGAAGLALAVAGDVDGGLEHFDEALAAAADTDDPALEARLASNRVYVLWRAGRPSEVERASAIELERLRVRGLEALGDQLAVGRVGALVTLGRLDEAAAAVSEARGMKMAADPAAHLDLVDAELALARAEVDRAAVLVERVAASPLGGLAELVGERHALAAAVEAARGRHDRVARVAEDGVRRCADGDLLASARLALWWWRARRSAVGRHADASDVGAVPEPVAAVTARLSEDGNSRELEAIGATIRALRDHDTDAWSAAAAAWAAVPAPLEVLRCRLAMAALAGTVAELEAIGDECRRIGAFGLAAEADDAARAAGGRRATPRLPGLLTTREVEVLACVAEGLTNKEIATRLYISVRTVGAHLERAMAKLHAGTRGAAVHEARRRGLLV